MTHLTQPGFATDSEDKCSPKLYSSSGAQRAAERWAQPPFSEYVVVRVTEGKTFEAQPIGGTYASLSPSNNDELGFSPIRTLQGDMDVEAGRHRPLNEVMNELRARHH